MYLELSVSFANLWATPYYSVLVVLVVRVYLALPLSSQITNSSKLRSSKVMV